MVLVSGVFSINAALAILSLLIFSRNRSWICSSLVWVTDLACLTLELRQSPTTPSLISCKTAMIERLCCFSRDPLGWYVDWVTEYNEEVIPRLACKVVANHLEVLKGKKMM